MHCLPLSDASWKSDITSSSLVYELGQLLDAHGAALLPELLSTAPLLRMYWLGTPLDAYREMQT